MDHFHYRGGHYFAEDVSLEQIAGDVGTPCYVYSRATMEHHWKVFDAAFGDHPHTVLYAVKANGNLAVLNLLSRLGSGFDIVSGGELERVLQAGGRASEVVFSGVGKSEAEITRALEVGVRCLNLESAAELERVNRLAGDLGVTAPVALRINPDVDPGTHPYIATGLRENKFGIPAEEARSLYGLARDCQHVEVTGVACHIGSQLTQLSPFTHALDRVLDFVFALQDEGLSVEHLDLGGGLGIPYIDESPPQPDDYVQALLETMARRDCRLPVSIEPGRAIMGNAGLLLTRVEYLKPGNQHGFAVVDAAMNDLLRPALYQARHEVVEVSRGTDTPECYDVVGPVCESGDFLARDKLLSVKAGDLLAIRSAGAYGFVMSSNYNARPRPAEVIVDGSYHHVVRTRETTAQLFDNEQLVPQ